MAHRSEARSVAAPLSDVWSAYTNPADIMVWNAGSPDWHTTAASVDLRPGGKFSSRMEAKDGSFGFDFAGEYTRVGKNRPNSATFAVAVKRRDSNWLDHHLSPDPRDPGCSPLSQI